MLNAMKKTIRNQIFKQNKKHVSTAKKIFVELFRIDRTKLLLMINTDLNETHSVYSPTFPK